MKYLILLPLLLACNGCVGVAKVTRALAKDPATIAVKINTVYGTASIIRVGALPPGTSATVSPDGTVIIKTP